jgi:hypothetical protein
MKDLANMVALIETLELSADDADLNPYVRDEYFELWHGVHGSPVGPVGLGQTEILCFNATYSCRKRKSLHQLAWTLKRSRNTIC